MYFPQRANERGHAQMIHQTLCPAAQAGQVEADAGAVTSVEENERSFAAQPPCSAPGQVARKEWFVFQNDRRFVHESLIVVAM